MTHDQLQYSCFSWLWNEHPELRKTFWGSFSDIKQVEAIIGNIGNDKRRIILSKMKSLGMVKGILDFVFYHKSVLYVMDFKVGSDRLSEDQLEFIRMIELNGGKGYEVKSLEGFKSLINGII